MNNASHLLASACAAFKEAALALNGPLERDVEASAAKCWNLKERSVQVKGIDISYIYISTANVLI